MEISYLRGACEATRWEGESKESVDECCSISACTTGVSFGVVEWLKRNTLKTCGYVERMRSEEFVKVYDSELKGPNRRGRPLGRWRDRVEEYLGEEDNSAEDGKGDS